MGIYTRQDIVISGHYQAIQQKNAADQTIKTKIFLLDVSKKKVISDVVIDLPADSSLFARVEDLATRVAYEARSVLPNKGEIVFQAPLAEDPAGPWSAGLLAGTSLAALPGAFSSSYPSKDGLVSKDFTPVVLQLYADYHDRKNNMRYDAMIGLQLGSRTLPVENDSRDFTGSLTDISAAVHAGYDLPYKQFHFAALAGLGYSIAGVEFDYSNLTHVPKSGSGKSLTRDELNSSAPFVEGGLRIDWQLQTRLLLSLLPLYRQSFYTNRSVGQFLLLGGAGYRI